jgi:2-oxoglutarate dehydrogenase complex dehydrogenase (E1) component-like enzyme
MMMLRHAFLSSAIFLGLGVPLALADKPAPAPAKVEVSKADADRFMAFFNKLIDILVATQDDCAKMTTQLNAHLDANAALVKEMNSPENKNKDIPKEYKDKMNARVKKEMMPALQKKCIQDKGVQAAMERMSK